MTKTTIKVATVLAAIALLAGCTATTPGAAPSSPAGSDPTPSAPAPAPTVTVTVTATPEPEEPVGDEMPDPPVMSSAEAIEQCLDYQKTAGTGSAPTGQPYAFLMHNGSWFVIINGENEHGTMYISCAVGGDPAVAYGESAIETFDPTWLDSVINGNGLL